MIRTGRSGDILSGLILALLGLLTAWASMSIAEGAGGRLHPRTFPLILGVLLCIGGLGLFFNAWIKGSGQEKAIDWPDRKGWKSWAVALASMALYVGLSDPLGFLISTFLFVAGFIWYFGRYNPAVALLYALGLAGFVYFIFIRLLELTLPMGPLSFL
jgi:putative tricarboxylic transport membrane protein